jgi:hypothetical protein
MPTLQGIIFIPLGLYFLFARPRYLFPLLIASTPFQASTVVSAGSRGIQPYYCIASLFVIRFLLSRGADQRSSLRPRSTFALLWIAFVILSVISAAVLPVLFQGLPGFGPEQTMEENALNPTSLHYQVENLIQPVFLLLNVLVVFAAADDWRSIRITHKMFVWSSYFVVLIVLLQVSFFWCGLPFPTKLLNNSPTGFAAMESGQVRPGGSFMEPSMVGAVLAAVLAALLWKYLAGKSGIIRVAMAAAALLLTASSSSLLSGVLVVIILGLANPVFRFPCFIRVNTLKRLSGCLVLAMALALLMIAPGVRAMVLAQTFEKGASGSAFARFAADASAIQITTQTWGLGVGLGSNRPSSLVAALLSQVGVIGFVLFVSAGWSTLRSLPKEHRWIGMAAVGLLLSMAIGLPDLSFPFLWILFALAAQSKAYAAYNLSLDHGL